MNPQNPMIVQSDGSVLLEVENPLYDAARDGLARFAELEKSPEHIHTYRITPLSLWNAAAAGVDAGDDDRDAALLRQVRPAGQCPRRHPGLVGRYGRVKLDSATTTCVLSSD